jgi:thiamine pyrophosphokinase
MLKTENSADITVVLADGAAPEHEVAMSVFRGAGRLIACDGAWRTAVALGRIPDVVTGDCDSLNDDDFSELARLGVPVVRDCEQDTNDLCKAFRFAVRSYPSQRIVILGATGKREDHTIGNIFHLVDFSEIARDVAIVTNSGVFEPVPAPRKDWEDVSAVGCALSVFAVHPDTVMRSEGLKWPLDGVSFSSLWRGTLNKVTSPRFTVFTDRAAIVFRPHPSLQGEDR